MIIHDRDGLSPVQVARINRLEIARYRKPLTEAEQIVHARKLLRYGLTILCVCWALGLAYMILQTKPHHGHAVHVPGGIEIHP